MSLQAKHITIIIIVALVARIVLGLAIFSHNNYDVKKSIIGHDCYYETAVNILHGNGFSCKLQPPYTPNIISAPIYPYLLALILLIFKSNLAIIIIQGFASVLIPVLSYLVVKRVTRSPIIALATGLFLAIEPYTAMLAITMLTETVFTILWLLFVIFLHDFLNDKTYKNIVFSAIFFALATLTRPNIQFLLVLTPIFIWWRFRRDWSRDLYYKIALYGVIIIVIISPWLYHNYKTIHKITISAHVSDSLYLYLLPSAITKEKGISFEQARLEFYKQENINDIDDILKPENSQKYTKRAIILLAKHPIGLTKSLTATVVGFFTHDGYLDIIDRFGYKPILPSSLANIQTLNYPGAIILFGRALWIFITISFSMGAILFIKRHPKNQMALWALCTIFYFAGITLIIGLGVNARFRFAINTFIIMFSFYAWHSLIKSFKANK